MSGRNAQVTRIYAIIDILEGLRAGLTVAELTERLKERGHLAGRRTVYRDLEALTSAGFPLAQTGESGERNSSKWILERVTRVSEHFVLSSREILALFFAKGVLTPLRDTPFFHDLQLLFGKIEARLGERATEHLKELQHEIHFQPGPKWGLGIDPDVLETVRACCAEKQILSVTYASASKGEKKLRSLGPHYLYYAQGSLYLVAEDLTDKTVKVFSVPRMTEATMSDTAYEGDCSDPAELFQGSFGVFRGARILDVKLHVAPVLAPFVRERQWHDSQKVITKSDGSLLVSLEVANTPELIQWILSLGQHATVLEPTELKESILAAARQIVGKYRERAA